MNYKLEISNIEENEFAEKAMQELDEAFNDSDFANEMKRVSAEGAILQLIPQANPCEFEPKVDIEFTKKVEAKKQNLRIRKLKDVEDPIIGIYQGKEPCKFGCAHGVLTEKGLEKIYGCADLDAKLFQIPVGKRVYIARDEIMITSNGRAFVKADVRV